MPFVVFFIVLTIVLPIAILSAKQKEAARRAAASKNVQSASVNPVQGTDRAPVPAGTSEGQPLRTAQRRPLERPSMQKTIAEKPVASHSEESCGGGSIHDGYHEGVTRFDRNRPAAVAGNLGHSLSDEDDRLAREKASAENARRALARIGRLPPLAQGMIYSEILGKPKSETA